MSIDRDDGIGSLLILESSWVVGQAFDVDQGSVFSDSVREAVYTARG